MPKRCNPAGAPARGWTGRESAGLARADAEARLPEVERIDLHRWLPAHLQTWAEHPRSKDIRLEAEGSGSGPVELHPVLLGELVNILLDNACKFSRPGTPIKVRLRREERAACIQVEDQGCGISATDLPHVFTPFSPATTRRQRGVEGSGLGLSIAKRLAGVLGGVLSVSSDAAHGSCFTLSLSLTE